MGIENHARVLSSTLANGYIKNETRQKTEGRRRENKCELKKRLAQNTAMETA